MMNVYNINGNESFVDVLAGYFIERYENVSFSCKAE